MLYYKDITLTRHKFRKIKQKYFEPKRIIRQTYQLHREMQKHTVYLQPIITQYFIDNKSEIWLLFLIAHSKR